jgi:hypothetical protein
VPLSVATACIPENGRLLLCSEDYNELMEESPSCKICNKKCVFDVLVDKGGFFHAKCKLLPSERLPALDFIENCPSPPLLLNAPHTDLTLFSKDKPLFTAASPVKREPAPTPVGIKTEPVSPPKVCNTPNSDEMGVHMNWSDYYLQSIRQKPALPPSITRLLLPESPRPPMITYQHPFSPFNPNDLRTLQHLNPKAGQRSPIEEIRANYLNNYQEVSLSNFQPGVNVIKLFFPFSLTEVTHLAEVIATGAPLHGYFLAKI